MSGEIRKERVEDLKGRVVYVLKAPKDCWASACDRDREKFVIVETGF